MRYLRFNTAARLTVGPFLDKTDGITPEVALTVTSEKLTFVVDEANVPTLILDVAPTASGGSNDMVHITGDDAGYYDLELAAADTNHLGRAMLSINDVATHCPVFHEFMIVPAVVYDATFLGTDNLAVNTTKVGGTTQTARDLGQGIPNAVPGAAGGVFIAGTNAATAITTGLTSNVIGNVTGNLSGSVGSVTGAVGSVTGAVGSVTGAVGSVTAAVTLPTIPSNWITAAGINADAITAAKVADGAIDAATFAAGAINAAAIAADAITDAKVASDVTIASVTGAVGSVTGAVGSVTGNVGGNVVGSVATLTTLPTIPANWLTAAGTAADFTTEIQTGLATTDAIVDAILDEVIAGHNTAGTVGKAIIDAGAAGTPPTAAAIADAVWDEATTGHVTSGTFGEQVKTDIDAILVDTAEIGAAGAGLTNINLPNQTMDIVGNITGNLSGSVGSVTGAVGSVTGAVNSVTTAVTLPTIPTNWITAAGINADAITAAKVAADVTAEISDGVWDEAIAGHLGAGSTGAAVNAAGSTGDPWTTPLPGAYGSGTAGKIIGDKIVASVTGAVGSVTAAVALTSGERNSVADALLDRAAGVETNRTPRQAFRLMLASLAGKISGAAGTTVTIRDTNDTVNRVVATVDADGNRSALTLDAS